MVAENEPHEFSPFDAPVKDTGKQRPSVDNTGIKMEPITDAELDGGKTQNPFAAGAGSQPNPNQFGGPQPNLDMPKDAPEFQIPIYDDVPAGEIPKFTQGGPNTPGGAPAPGAGGSGGGGNSGGVKVDENFSKEWAEYTAGWLIDIFFNLLVMGLQRFAMIDRSEFINAVNSGLIDKKYLKYVEEANENTKKAIFVTEDEKKMVVEPLKRMMEVKKISVKPEYMVLGSLAMVGISVGMRAMDVKKSNTELLDRMVRESAEDRAARTQNRSQGSQSGGGRNRYEESPETESFSESQEKETPGFTVIKNEGEGTVDDLPLTPTEEVSNDN